MTVSYDRCFQCQSLLQFIDYRACLVLLDKANRRVEQEQGTNYSKIDPVLETGGQNRRSLIVSKIMSIM